MNAKQKIIRTWRGWTTIENVSIYEEMLINEIFPAIKKKGIEGLEKVNISTQEKNDDVEFFLVLQFDCIKSVKIFAGDDYEIAYIPDNVQRVLLRYEKSANHYEFKRELILWSAMMIKK